MIDAAEIDRLLALALDRFGMPEGAAGVDRLRAQVAAALEAVHRYAGAPEEVQHIRYPHRTLVIITARPIASITSITERTRDGLELELDPSDFRVIGRYQILRRHDGAHPGNLWAEEITVHYQAEVDQALRDECALDLVEIARAGAPALRSETLADYRRDNWAPDDRELARQSILDRLTEGRAPAW